MAKRKAETDALGSALAPATSRAKRRGSGSGSRARGSGNGAAATVHDEVRLQMVREAAYYRALERGFAGGNPEQDWADAEAQIDRMLAGEVKASVPM